MSLLKNERTLEVTVQKLIDAVNNHYDVDRVLADYGIKVLGTGNYTTDIPGYPDSYTGEYGDAYLLSVNVDSQAPFNTWVWTRNGDGGIWLNIGELSIVGPQGPQGPKGDKGDTGSSSKWYVGTISPASSVQSPQEGDCYLNVTTGNVEYYERAMWVYKGNIAGPAGANGSPGLTPYIENGYWWIGSNNTGVRAEGRDGATGTPGPAIDIVANLASIDLLPTPTEDIRHRGYLITSGTENRLYFVAGVDELYWDYIVFDGNGTVVTVDGVGQTSWETNTKLDKSNSTNTLYGVAADGTQGNFSFSIVPKYGAMARFGDGGRLRTNEPTTELECANKAYVDDTAATKADKINTPWAVYSTDGEGNQTYNYLAYQPSATRAIPLYGLNKTLKTSTPIEDNDCANKAYVDAALPQYKTEVLKLTSPGNTPYVLSIDQLTNRVGGTPVHITYVQGAHLAAPSNEIALGNTSIVESNDWEGIPYLNNNNTFQSFTVNISHTGDLFYINKRNESGTIAANSITFGMTHSATTDNQTIIITYTATTSA